MSKEAILMVISAEEQAKELVSKANSEAELMIKEAKEKAESDLRSLPFGQAFKNQSSISAAVALAKMASTCSSGVLVQRDATTAATVLAIKPGRIS